MSEFAAFPAGGYRYIPAVFQYSGGVAAAEGYEIHRVRFSRPPALAEGFAAIEAHLKSAGRPLSALCGCELRSPAPFTEQGFTDFNRLYVQTLQRWGLCRDADNPVARTNVCPVADPPPSPSFHAFSYTVARTNGRGTFVIAGGGEAPEGKANYHDHIVRRGDTSTDAMREKVRYVVGQMQWRLAALGCLWRDALATHAYTRRDIGILLWEELARAGVSPEAITWHYCVPPVVDLEFEMDLRAVAREIVL